MVVFVHHMPYHKVLQLPIYQFIERFTEISSACHTQVGYSMRVTSMCRHLIAEFASSTCGNFESNVIDRCMATGLAHSRSASELHASLQPFFQCFFFCIIYFFSVPYISLKLKIEFFFNFFI